VAISQPEYDVLDKGLKYIPSIKYTSKKEITTELTRVIRNLRLKEFFKDKEDKPYDHTVNRFLPPSNWWPPRSAISAETRDTIRRLYKQKDDLFSKFGAPDSDNLRVVDTQNLSRAEREAIKQLKGRPGIIIKPADKGSSIVIMDRSKYVEEAERQLSDTNYYRQLDAPIYKSNIAEINRILTRLVAENFISAKQYQYLCAKDSDRGRLFYLLPKIHKTQDKWPNPGMPPGRPIVSNCGSESKRIAEYIDSFLRPLANKHKSYLKDTYDFVSKIRGQVIQPTDLLVTGDVTALYTNMNISRTIAIVKRHFEATRKIAQNRPDTDLIRLLEIIMRKNDFEFNGKFYLQTCGTGMGIDPAPNLANLYLLHLDQMAVEGFRIRPRLYFRFLDDIFFVWRGSTSDLQEYNTFLNGLIPGIKITLECQKESISFLDTNIYKKNSNEVCILQTRVFFKATDTHQLLHTQSFHPRHCTSGILKSQLLRFKRISSSKGDFDSACRTLFEVLVNRGYAKRLLRKMKTDIWHKNSLPTKREEAGERSSKKIFPIVVKYDSVGEALSKAWRRVLGEHSLLQNYRLISAYKIHKNLRRILVHTKMQ
jgi:hypothetical protein